MVRWPCRMALGKRARTLACPEGEFWLANPTAAPSAAGATMIPSCLRDDYHSVVKSRARCEAPFLLRAGAALGPAGENRRT